MRARMNAARPREHALPAAAFVCHTRNAPCCCALAVEGEGDFFFDEDEVYAGLDEATRAQVIAQRMQGATLGDADAGEEGEEVRRCGRGEGGEDARSCAQLRALHVHCEPPHVIACAHVRAARPRALRRARPQMEDMDTGRFEDAGEDVEGEGVEAMGVQGAVVYQREPPK